MLFPELAVAARFPPSVILPEPVVRARMVLALLMVANDIAPPAVWNSTLLPPPSCVPLTVMAPVPDWNLTLSFHVLAATLTAEVTLWLPNTSCDQPLAMLANSPLLRPTPLSVPTLTAMLSEMGLMVSVPAPVSEPITGLESVIIDKLLPTFVVPVVTTPLVIMEKLPVWALV